MINKQDQNFESKRDFETFIKANDEPIVVIIEANWSGNCQIMAPAFEKIESLFKSKVNFVTVTGEASEILELNYDSDILPKIILYNKGRIIDQIFGIVSFEQLEEKINALSKASSKNILVK
ncbi:thioredoxin family protein [Bacteroidota bacterium]